MEGLSIEMAWLSPSKSSQSRHFHFDMRTFCSVNNTGISILQTRFCSDFSNQYTSCSVLHPAHSTRFTHFYRRTLGGNSCDECHTTDLVHRTLGLGYPLITWHCNCRLWPAVTRCGRSGLIIIIGGFIAVRMISNISDQYPGMCRARNFEKILL